MAESSEMWKQRYEFSVETQERLARDHRELVQQLARALNRISLACEGQDPALDAELQGLRAFLRLKTLSTDVLASKIDVVEERLRGLEQRQRFGDPRVREALELLLGQINAAKPPRDTARAAANLAKELRGGADVAELLLRALALGARARQALPVAGNDVADPSPEARVGGGFFARLFGRPTASGTAGATEVASRAESVPDAANRALDALIDMVPAPAADPGMRGRYEAAKLRLARGVRWPELVSAIEDIRVLAGAALARSRDEFGGFLKEMSERLDRTAAALAEDGGGTLARRGSAIELDAVLLESVGAIRKDVATATDLEQLKHEVSMRVEAIGTALDSFREREERLLAVSEAAARTLSERVEVLRAQTGAAEALLVEQRRLALTDPLTQLPNREALNGQLSREEERYRRYGRPLSLAVCDIDRFKAVNDRYGHATGDAVLREVAACLRESLRETDFVARFGGEEFVILLPETAPEQAAGALDTVRMAVAARRVECRGAAPLNVTVSFGVACFGEGDDAERVFIRADAALYQAKGAGRDRVIVFGEDAASPV